MAKWEQDTIVEISPNKWQSDPLISQEKPYFEPTFVENPAETEAKAKSNLDTALEYDLNLDVVNSGLFDVVSRMSNDPIADPQSGMLTGGEPFGVAETEAIKSTSRFMLSNPVSRVVWKGLGAIGWPFQRMENLMAGPLTPISKESARRASLTIKYIMDKANGLEPSEEAKEAVELQNFFQYIREHAVPAYKEAGRALIPAVKAFNPWSKVPQKDLKNFTDWYRGYWMGWMNDEPPPEWIAQPVGLATSFVVTPFVVGKVFRLAGKLGKATPVYKAIQEYRIPEYQAAKGLTRLETRAGVYDAERLGKTISQNDLTEIAEQISAKVGKPISPAAVQKRMVQIIKGGITEQPALAAKATPIVEEFRNNAQILREYGILSNYTYTTKLTKSQAAKINKTIDGAEKQLTRLQAAPHYIGTKEISAEFPGRADKIRKLEETIQSNLDRLYTNEIYGGANYFPRLYLTKEAELAGKRFPFWGKGRIRAPYAKARAKIPAEVRKEMGEMLTEYPVVKRLIQENIDIELAKHYRQIAQTPGWTSSVEAPGFKMLPEDKAYGELAGKFVKSVIFNDMKDMHKVKNNIEVLYDTAIGSWKAAVTVWSPSLHFRNMFSNSILLDLSGVDHIEQGKLLTQAIKEISNNSDDYQQARRYLTRGTFAQSELLDDLLAGNKAATGTGIQKSINFVAASSKRLSSVPSDIYGKEEFTAKFVKYLSERNKGKDVISAVQEANKWLFDYGDLASWEKNYARRLMPFYCVPEDTEILTKNGWKKRPDLKMGEKVLTYNVNGDFTEWQSLKAVAKFNFEGNLISLSSGKNDANKWRFTDEHRFPIIGWKGKRQILPFNKLNTSHSIPLARMVRTKDECDLSDKELAVLSWIVTDGYFRWRGNSCEMMIYQSPKKYLSEICLLLGSDLLSESIHPTTGVYCLRLKQTLVKRLSEYLKSKKGFLKLVCLLSTKKLQIVYDTMVKAEGCLPAPTLSGSGRTRMTNVLFAQNAGPILDAFQIVCQLLGKSFQINSRGGNVKRKQNLFIHSAKVNYENYSGIVWCPQTENQTWVMRQNGKVIITGNTFPRKAIPVVLESIAQNPHTIAKYPMMMWAMEKYSLHRLGLTEKDYADIKKIMPDYMQNGSYMLMPYRDDNGDLRFFDVTYILPWGTISDFQQRGAFNVVVSNPMLQWVGDIQRNKDSFTGKKIWEDTDTEKEKFTKQVLHFWQSAAPLPPWFPGGIYYDKIYEAMTGKPSKKWDILLDKKPLLPETLLHTIGGIRLAPLDVEKQTMFYWQEKQEHLIELEKKLSDALIQHSAGNLDAGQLQRIRDQYIQQMVDLISDPEETAAPTISPPKGFEMESPTEPNILPYTNFERGIMEEK